MAIIDDPMGHRRAEAETERRHPLRPGDEPPAGYGRRQLIALGVVILFAAIVALLWRVI